MLEVPTKPTPRELNSTAKFAPVHAMRLSNDQIRRLKTLVAEELGESARLRLFGSRLDDDAKGGDIDVLVELTDPVSDPAPLVARLAVRASRAMDGRKVDVVLLAPNLQWLPIHEAALRQGVML